MNNSKKKQQENPFINILFNIILPVVILNQLTKRLGEDGPLIALLVALAFPVIYGIYDYITRKKKNALSILGIINVLFTGGLALMNVQGIWFAVKEAAFPFIIGVAVYISAFTKNPAMKLMACNENVMNFSLIEEKLNLNNSSSHFLTHLRQSTKLLAVSFFISSLLNFFLARYIFTDIDPLLSEMDQSAILNEQIAQMTWLSFIVIVLPLMIFMGFIMWHLFSGIKKHTNLTLNEILPHSHQ